MKHVAILAAVSLVTLLVAGCSKSHSSSGGDGAGAPGAAGPAGGSCMQAGICTEYADNPGGLAEGMCTSMLKGTYSKGACPTDNTIGTCTSKDEKNVYYFGNSTGPWTEDAASDCKSVHDGTFAATAGAAETAKQKALPTPDKILGSCQQSSGLCDDYYGDPLKVGLSKTFCEPDGKWSDGKACPTDGLAATCLSGGAAHRYYTSYMKKTSTTTAGLQQLCSGGSIGYAHFYPAPGAAVAAVPTNTGRKGKGR